MSWICGQKLIYTVFLDGTLHVDCQLLNEIKCLFWIVSNLLCGMAESYWYVCFKKPYRKVKYEIVLYIIW